MPKEQQGQNTEIALEIAALNEKKIYAAMLLKVKLSSKV